MGGIHIHIYICWGVLCIYIHTPPNKNTVRIKIGGGATCKGLVGVVAPRTKEFLLAGEEEFLDNQATLHSRL